MARTTRAQDDAAVAVIGPSTQVRGRVSGDGHLTLEGSLEGDVSIGGDVTIEGGARATSMLEAEDVTIRGQLEGDVHARGTVRIESSARVRGDVQGDAVSIEEGAEFVGRLECEFDLPAELTAPVSRQR